MLTLILYSLASCVVLYALLLVGLIVFGQKRHLKTIATLVPSIILLVKRLASHPDTPRRHKALLLGALVWFASPLDLVPEFLPVIGPLDDLVVAALVLRVVLRHHKPGTIRELWSGSPAGADLVMRAVGA